MRAGPTAVAVAVAVASLVLAGAAAGRSGADVRVTVFGDSVATAMAYDPDAKRTLGRGIDLALEVAACRRVGDTSCPYDGVRPPNVIDRATELGRELGPVVVVIAGYNDYEDNYAENVDDAMAVFRKAGVEHVLWATLREDRQSWANMNDMIRAAARKYPEMTVLDWNALAKQSPDWLQPDGIHLTPAGAEGMATMVNDALVQLGVAPKPVPPTARKLLAIASRALPVGHRGRAYLANLRATGGTAPYRWARTGGTLAPGLRLATNGRLTGVPGRSGTFELRARVIDRTGTARTRVFSLRIL
jgi:hypothetical protein